MPISVGGLSEPGLAPRGAPRPTAGSRCRTPRPRSPAAIDDLDRYRAEYGRADEPFEINALCTDAFDLDGYRRLADAGVTELQAVPWYFSGRRPGGPRGAHRLAAPVRRRGHRQVLIADWRRPIRAVRRPIDHPGRFAAERRPIEPWRPATPRSPRPSMSSWSGSASRAPAAAIAAAEAGAEVLALERGTRRRRHVGPLGRADLPRRRHAGAARRAGTTIPPRTWSAFLLAACGPEHRRRPRCTPTARARSATSTGSSTTACRSRASSTTSPTGSRSTTPGSSSPAARTPGRSPKSPIRVPRGHHPQFPDTAGGFLMDRARRAREARPRHERSPTRASNGHRDRRRRASSGVAVAASTATDARASGRVAAWCSPPAGSSSTTTMLEHYCPPTLRARRGVAGRPAQRRRPRPSASRPGRGRRTAQHGRVRVRAADRPAAPAGARDARQPRGERASSTRTPTPAASDMRALLEQDGEIYMIVSEEHLRGQLRRHAPDQWAAETRRGARPRHRPPRGHAGGDGRELQPHAAERARTRSGTRPPEFVVPLRPPLGAVDLRVDQKAIYAPFTLGGLATDVDGAGPRRHRVARSPVCTPRAAPPPGIAAGGYVSGISLGDGSFFGRRAGSSAAG